MSWLLDTDTLSELRRPRPDPHVTAFVASRPLQQMFVSVVTLAEIRYGIHLVTQDNQQRQRLNDWLEAVIRPMFRGNVLPVSEDVMLTWRIILQSGRNRGHTFSQPDLIIAATAKQHGLTVVTRNLRDYDKAGVAILNPWEFRT